MGSVRYMGINNLEINLKFMNVFTVFSFFFGINFILEIAFERISTRFNGFCKTVAVNAIVFKILALLVFLFVMDLIAPCMNDFTKNVPDDTNNECSQADINFLSS